MIAIDWYLKGAEISLKLVETRDNDRPVEPSSMQASAKIRCHISTGNTELMVYRIRNSPVGNVYRRSLNLHWVFEVRSEHCQASYAACPHRSMRLQVLQVGLDAFMSRRDSPIISDIEDTRQLVHL